MPKAPIQARRGFFETLRDKTIRLLDWNVVDTELGFMVEPRQDVVGIPTPAAAGTLLQIDLTDAAFTYLSQLDSNTFYSQFGTDGNQVPVEFNA